MKTNTDFEINSTDTIPFGKEGQLLLMKDTRQIYKCKNQCWVLLDQKEVNKAMGGTVIY